MSIYRARHYLVATMLEKTLAQLGETDLPIIHSDQGCLYGLERWRKMLIREDGSPYALQSMSLRGNCYDNAVIESFFSLLKSECFMVVNLQRWMTWNSYYTSIFVITMNNESNQA